MEDVGRYILSIFWQFGLVYGNLVYMFPVLVHLLHQEKSGNPGRPRKWLST
jgi:hypothetical protein